MVELLLSMWKAKQPKELVVNAPAFVKALARYRLSAMVTMRMLISLCAGRNMIMKCQVPKHTNQRKYCCRFAWSKQLRRKKIGIIAAAVNSIVRGNPQLQV